MKRTEQIDYDRQVILPFRINGKPAWTKAGGTLLSPVEKEQLSENLIRARFRGEVEQIAEAALIASTKFVEKIIRDIAPADVISAFDDAEDNEQSAKKLCNWIDENGFSAIQDGLRLTVKIKDKVLAETVFHVESKFRIAVERTIRRLCKA